MSHMHIGKLMDGVETSHFVESPAKIEDIPIPPMAKGSGYIPWAAWLHVHTGEQVTEFV